MVTGDTIAAIATAPGRSGVAVIRVSGPEAFGIAERLTGRVGVGRHRPVSVSVGPIYSQPTDTCRHLPIPIDTGLLLTFKAPHSYTGEDVVEFQCHGGTVTPRRVLEACLSSGARLAHRGEFTERAFLNGKLDYDQAESVLDLIDAKTARAAEAALEGLSGRKQRELKALYDQALELSSTVEHALDIDEGELPEGFLENLKSQISNFRKRIVETIRKAHEGKILREGALVVLAGPPNAGKSSLMNALLEENRAIVSAVPGTTRDSIEEGLDLDGWPIRLVDTAGLRETKDEIEGEGVRRSEELIEKADVVLRLGSERSERSGRDGRVIEVFSKCDLGRGPGLNVSAKTGEGLDELKRAIVAKLEARVASADSSSLDVDRLAALREVLSLLSNPPPVPCSPFPVPSSPDLVLLGNALRQVAEKIGSLIGAVYSEDLLENLFSRFCVGK